MTQKKYLITNQINSFIGFLMNKLMDDFFGKTFCGLSNENFQLNINDKVNCPPFIATAL